MKEKLNFSIEHFKDKMQAKISIEIALNWIRTSEKQKTKQNDKRLTIKTNDENVSTLCMVQCAAFAESMGYVCTSIQNQHQKRPL